MVDRLAWVPRCAAPQWSICAPIARRTRGCAGMRIAHRAAAGREGDSREKPSLVRSAVPRRSVCLRCLRRWRNQLQSKGSRQRLERRRSHHRPRRRRRRPDGRYFASARDGKLVIGTAGDCNVLPVSAVTQPSRIAFAPEGLVAYVSLRIDPQRLCRAARLAQGALGSRRADEAVQRSARAAALAQRQGAARDGRRPGAILDPATGDIVRSAYKAPANHRRRFPRRRRSAADARAPVGREHPRDAARVLARVADGSLETLAVPNCSARLSVSAQDANRCRASSASGPPHGPGASQPSRRRCA